MENYKITLRNAEIFNFKEVKLFSRNGEEEIQCTYSIRYSFDYKEFFISLLEGIKVTTFFNNFYSKSCARQLPSKAHVFTAISVNSEHENELPDLLYWLRKGYKSTYNPSESARELENNKEIVRCFSDSIWGISREAVANVIYDSSTFLYENYHSRLDIYFYLYLLVLHQYYGLLLLAKDATELSSKSSSYIKHKEYYKLKNIRERINFFYLKCVFTETSHISHQSELYKCMWDRLGVESMLLEIQYEVERITIMRLSCWIN